MNMCVCVCVCVREREREIKREFVYVRVLLECERALEVVKVFGGEGLES